MLDEETQTSLTIVAGFKDPAQARGDRRFLYAPTHSTSLGQAGKML